jgi:hypothetical protein
MSQQNLGDISSLDSPSNNSTLNNRYQKSEPFLWFHIALLAAVPLTFILGMLGLGVGDPVLPEWFEILVIGLPPIALPIILQWSKPLSPFSLWLYAKPLELTDDNERRILAVVKNFNTVPIAIAIGVLADAIFYQMYVNAPLVADILPLPDGLRILGIIWALAFFLISNLLLQAGAVAIRVLLLSEADLDKLTPLPLENINTFTSLGKRSPRLLNFIPESIGIATLETKPLVKSDRKAEAKVEDIPEVPETESPTTASEESKESNPTQNVDVIEDNNIKTEVVETETLPEESVLVEETTISVIESAWESPISPTSESN